jgi:hypothetical protein
MKSFLLAISIIVYVSANGQSTTFYQKNGSLSSDVTNADVDFSRTATDITIQEAGNYMILISAQGSTKAVSGDPFKCFHRDGMVKVWSRTRNIELVRTPINYIHADQNSQTVGNPPGLIQTTFPYYNIMIMQLNQGETIGLKGNVSKQCTGTVALGKWNIFDARIKIVKL